MRVGIVFKKGVKKSESFAGKVEAYLKSKKIDVCAEDKLEGVDYILTFGGDGTLIHKACEYAHFGATFVGINTGNLGFLTASEAADWQKVVDVILEGKIVTSERIILEVKVGSKVFRGVNEAVIKGMYRVIDLGIRVNEVEFIKMLGDGVIVATQTGSTAYSLSAGGPIVDPDLDSLLITPVNPIGLPIPSAVLSSWDKIEIEVLGGEDVSLIIDGQEHTKVPVGQKVSVESGAHKVKLGYLNKDHFIRALNMKFGLANRVKP